MAKLTLTDYSGGFASVEALNDNNALIEAAMENTLSLDGTTPNSMQADFDMNSNRVLNLPEPLNSNEAARLQDVQNALAGGSANLISFTPSGSISSTNLQAALEELDSDFTSNVDQELLTTSSPTFAGGTFTGPVYVARTTNPASVALNYNFEVQGTADVLSGLFCTGASSLATEAAFVCWAYDAGDNLNKTMSISTVWRDNNATNGYNAVRYNATYKSGGTSFDDLSIVQFGGKGVTLCSGTGAAADNPAAYRDGNTKLLIRGTASVGLDVNGTARVFGGSNDSTGTSALTRFRLGNNLSQDIFNIDVYGGNHSTNPNEVRILNGISAPLVLGTNGGNFTATLSAIGNFSIDTVGAGLRVKEGSNAKQGTATLVAGVAVVSNTSVTANSRIFLTSQVDGGTPGFLRVNTRTAGVSFTITSSSVTDTSTVAYQIFEPA